MVKYNAGIIFDSLIPALHEFSNMIVEKSTVNITEI